MTARGTTTSASDQTSGRWPATEPWDVAVIGGGPSGSAAALVLAQAGWTVLLVERRAEVQFKFGELLPPTAQPLLVRMGLDKAQLTNDHAPARGIVTSWGSPEAQYQDFIFNPYGDGLRLDRPFFDQQLRARAADTGAVVVTGVQLVAVRDEGVWRLSFDSPDERTDQTARFLVDCTGRRALVGSELGVGRTEFDRLFAFGVLYSAEREDPDPFLRIEAQPHGWLYSLQLPSRKRIVVFHTDSDLPSARAATDPDGFEALLSQSCHIGPFLREHGSTATTRPRAARACGARLDPVVGPRWLAAGDAVLSFDPLSSQGIYNAIESGFAAADALLAFEVGDEGAISTYEAGLDVATATYRQHYAHYYGTERRWSDETFWARRHS